MSTWRKRTLKVYARCLIVIVCTYLASTAMAFADNHGITPPSADLLPPSQEIRMGDATQDASSIDLYTPGSRNPLLRSTILDSPMPTWPLLPWISVATLGLVAVPRQRKQVVLYPSTEAERLGYGHVQTFPSACDDTIDHGKNAEVPEHAIPRTPKQTDGDGAIQAQAQAELVAMVLHELTNQLVIVHQHTALLTSYSRQSLSANIR